MSGMLKHILKELGFQPLAELGGGRKGVAICGGVHTSTWIFESKDPKYDIELCGNTKFNLAEPDSIKYFKNALKYCIKNKEKGSGCLQCPHRLDSSRDRCSEARPD